LFGSLACPLQAIPEDYGASYGSATTCPWSATRVASSESAFRACPVSVPIVPYSCSRL